MSRISYQRSWWINRRHSTVKSSKYGHHIDWGRHFSYRLVGAQPSRSYSQEEPTKKKGLNWKEIKIVDVVLYFSRLISYGSCSTSTNTKLYGNSLLSRCYCNTPTIRSSVMYLRVKCPHRLESLYPPQQLPSHSDSYLPIKLFSHFNVDLKIGI